MRSAWKHSEHSRGSKTVSTGGAEHSQVASERVGGAGYVGESPGAVAQKRSHDASVKSGPRGIDKNEFPLPSPFGKKAVRVGRYVAADEFGFGGEPVVAGVGAGRGNDVAPGIEAGDPPGSKSRGRQAEHADAAAQIDEHARRVVADELGDRADESCACFTVGLPEPACGDTH